MKPLLVGEDNPYSRDPKYALYPYPEGSAGHRLATVILEMPRAAYLRAFDRVNLCAGKWESGEARKAAIKIFDEDRVVVLLGAKVCGAFGVLFRPFTTTLSFAILPHPSGRCRLWSEPGAFERARTTLAAAGVSPIYQLIAESK